MTKIDNSLRYDSLTDEEREQKKKTWKGKFRDLGLYEEELERMDKKRKEQKEQQKDGKIDKDGFQKPEPPKPKKN